MPGWSPQVWCCPRDSAVVSAAGRLDIGFSSSEISLLRSVVVRSVGANLLHLYIASILAARTVVAANGSPASPDG